MMFWDSLPRQTSDPSHSLVNMAALQEGLLCVLGADTAIKIRGTDPSPSSRQVGCFPTWPSFPLMATAILNFQFGS